MLDRRNYLRATLTAFFVLTAGVATAQIARVAGIVRDVSGEPLKAALVTAESGSGSATSTTDDNGRFIIIGLQPGVWKFEVQAPGYLTETGELLVRALGGQNRPVTIALRRSGVVFAGPLSSVPGPDLQAELAAADSLFNQEKWDEAVAVYRAILLKVPTLGVIQLQIAAALRGAKNYDAAIAAYQELLKADPANEKARVGISMTNLERGDTQAAEQVLMEAATGVAPGREVLYSLAELERSQGRPAAAADLYQRAASADPSWGKPLYRLGELAITRGDEGSAARYLGEVIAVDPASPEAALAKTALDRLNNK